MAFSEQQRHGLHAKLEEVLGAEHAGASMTQMPSRRWADMATKRDLVLPGDRLEAKIEATERRILDALHRELNIQTRIMVLAIAATGWVIIAFVRL